MPTIPRNRCAPASTCTTSQTAPVIDFYRQHGQLTVVDGVGSLDEVFTRILEAIQPGHEVG